MATRSALRTATTHLAKSQVGTSPAMVLTAALAILAQACGGTTSPPHSAPDGSANTPQVELGRSCAYSCDGTFCRAGGGLDNLGCTTSTLDMPCLGTGTGMYCTKACSSDSDCSPASRTMRCLVTCGQYPDVAGYCWSASDYAFMVGQVCGSPVTPGTGGTSGSGGVAASGGVADSGGASAVAGAGGTSAVAGGATGTGGAATSIGGSIATGGITIIGGIPAIGGIPVKGGSTILATAGAAGGSAGTGAASTSVGGSKATGGAGGTAATGGSTIFATAGAAGGSAGTGATSPSTGGSKATGGTVATGGLSTLPTGGATGGTTLCHAGTAAVAVNLATNQPGLYGLGLDAQYVYWTTSDGTVMRTPVGGGTQDAVAFGQTNPRQVAANDTYVYWTTIEDTTFGSSSLYRVAKGGTTPELVASLGRYFASGLALDSSNAYVAAASFMDMGGTLTQAPFAGGKSVTLASGDMSQAGETIVTDSTYVYWTATSSATGSTDAVNRIAKDGSGGGTPLTLYSTSSSIGGIALAGTQLLVGVTTGLKTVPIAGGAPITFEGSRGYTKVLVSGAEIYAVSGKSVYCMPLDQSASPVLLVTATNTISAMLADDQSVYWSEASSTTTTGGGSIRKFAR